jgi:hypothetical protein
MSVLAEYLHETHTLDIDKRKPNAQPAYVSDPADAFAAA